MAALTALALEPVTGRTHQLRVHCAAMGWPILGDAVYGEAPRSAEPALHLHARAIELPLYPKREPVRAVAPIPERMWLNLAACGMGGGRWRLTLRACGAPVPAWAQNRIVGPPDTMKSRVR